MRFVIRLGDAEVRERSGKLARDPDGMTDERARAIAEAIWAEVPEGVLCEGVDLEDAEGRYLYTIMGDER